MNDIVTSVLFGSSLAISVGPIALLIMFNGLQFGSAVATRSAFGAACGDLIFALIAFAVGGTIAALLQDHQTLIRTSSSAILLILGGYMALNALRASNAALNRPPKKYGFTQTLALTLANPLTIVAFVAFAGQLQTQLSLLRNLALAFAVFIGSLAVQLVYAAFGSKLHTLAKHRWFTRSTQLASGVAIIALALLR